MGIVLTWNHMWWIRLVGCYILLYQAHQKRLFELFVMVFETFGNMFYNLTYKRTHTFVLKNIIVAF